MFLTVNTASPHSQERRTLTINRERPNTRTTITPIRSIGIIRAVAVRVDGHCEDP